MTVKLRYLLCPALVLALCANWADLSVAPALGTVESPPSAAAARSPAPNPTAAKATSPLAADGIALAQESAAKSKKKKLRKKQESDDGEADSGAVDDKKGKKKKRKSPKTSVKKKRRSGKGSSSGEKPESREKDVKAVNHLREVMFERNPHSLWILLCRSGVIQLTFGGKHGRVNIKMCRRIIESVAKSGNYKHDMKKFLRRLRVPRNWARVNEKKVAAFEKKYPNGIHVETKYYHILSTSDRDTTRELAWKMDMMTDQSYKKIFSFEAQVAYKYILRFFKNKAQFVKHGRNPGALAYYMPTTKELVGYNTKTSISTRNIDPFETLFHEGWHQYFDFYIPNAPRWYDEGLAEVVSPTVFKGRRAVRHFNARRSKTVNRALRQGELVDLRDLIKMSHREFYAPDIIHVAYAQAWSFVYFLVTYKHPNRKIQERVRNFYRDYFWELHNGTDPVEAVDIVFKDVKFDTLEAAWLKAIPRQK